MKTPLGTEVDIGAGHTVLDGLPALRERGTAPPLLGHVYCGHGRPSQLLLSSCLKSIIYNVCGKRCHYIFASNFAKCWPIFKILSPSVYRLSNKCPAKKR